MNKQRGLSLVELMISIALGLMLMVGVIQMFLSTKSSFTVQQGLSRIQETGRMAMEFIGHDLRMAAAVGCVRMQSPGKDTANVIDPIPTNKGGLHKDFLVGIMGYDTSEQLEASIPLESALGSMIPVDNSSILVIRGATERGFPVALNNTENSITVFRGGSTVSNDCIDGLCEGGVAVVSDCDSGRVFTAASLEEKSGGQLTITHNEAWDIAGIDINVYDARPEVFVYPMHTIVYFVAPGVSGEPSLWQRIDRQTSLELIQGVERIRFTYRVDDATDYVAASTVGALEWREVNAVRVDLVVRGSEQNALESVQTYTFPGDAAATTPTDRRLRQLFSNTFLLRSRNNQL